jgi:hypothetical protein
MTQSPSPAPAFVIKAEDVAALNYLDPEHPLPVLIEWINRGTDRKMRRTTIDLLLRTLYQDGGTPSTLRLHQAAGLRVSFATEQEREKFASAFNGACAELNVKRDYHVASLFANLELAQQVVAELRQVAIPEGAISMLYRADHLGKIGDAEAKGHSKLSVAAAAAGGGIAGALFGVGMLAIIPGLGPVIAAGAVAAAVIPSFTAISATLGATGGAMARMLTDQDVDGRDANYYEAQIRRGRVFVSVDTRVAEGKGEVARQILMRNGGKTLSRS